MEKVNAVLNRLNDAVDIHQPLVRHKTTQEKVKHYCIENNQSIIAATSIIAKPWSYHDFLERSLTFSKTRTWFAKPLSINPLVCSLYGWVNLDVDTLKCLNCQKILIHNKEDANGEKIYHQLKSDHEGTCPWFASHSPHTFLYFPEISYTQTINDYIHRFIQILKVMEVSLVRNACNKEFKMVIPKNILSKFSSLQNACVSQNNNNIIHCRGAEILKLSKKSNILNTVDSTNILFNTILPQKSILLEQFRNHSYYNSNSRLQNNIENITNNSFDKFSNHIYQNILLSQNISDVITNNDLMNLIYICNILSLCGWSPLALNNPVVNHKNDIEVPLASYDVRDIELLSLEKQQTKEEEDTRLCCHLCGRAIDINYFSQSCSSSNAYDNHHKRLSGGGSKSVFSGQENARFFDPLNQHRSYCPWVNIYTDQSFEDLASIKTNNLHSVIASDSNKKIEKMPGWEIVSNELFQTRSDQSQSLQQRVNEPVVSTNSTQPNSFSPNVGNSNHNKILDACSDITMITNSPENIYKRIKVILDGAV